MWTTIEPRRQTINIDCRGYREVLQARFRQAPVATLPQPKGADALGECPFNPRSFVILGFPLFGTLLLPDSWEDLMLALGAQRHMAWRRLRFGTYQTSLTVSTVFIGELDADNRILPSVLARAPRGTRFASGTGHLLGLPINLELTDVIGLLVPCLPGDVRSYRSNERHAEVPWTLHEQVVYLMPADKYRKLTHHTF